MAKIADKLAEVVSGRTVSGASGHLAARVLAKGNGWAVSDMICTSGPRDRSFEEQHSSFSIAIVAAGSFQYRCGQGRELMTPGSLLLGNAGQWFECGHEHGVGDRCLSFHYAPDCFENLAAGAGRRGNRPDFNLIRLPPVRALSTLIARACTGLARSESRTGIDGRAELPWEELSVELAGQAVQLANGLSSAVNSAPASTVARVTRAVRFIERHAGAGLTLGSLAKEARLGPYHFLRLFERVTGLTPHQYVRRVRLRAVAMRLAAAGNEGLKILDIALDSGFSDLSNFNRAFRAEFGVSPRVYREEAGA